MNQSSSEPSALITRKNRSVIPFILGNVFLLGVVFFLAYTYAFVTYLIPLKFVIPIILTFCLIVYAKLLVLGTRIAHIRLKRGIWQTSIVYSFVFLYVSWAAFLLMRQGEGYRMTLVFEQLISFQDLWADFLEYVNSGNKVYGGPTRDPIGNAVFWVLEVALIFIFPVYLIRDLVIHPYSEKNRRWYKEYVFKPMFERIAFRDNFMHYLTRDPVGIFKEIGYGGYGNHSRFYLYYDQKEDVQYISIVNVIQTTARPTKDRFLKFHPISKEEADEMMATHDHSRNYLSFL